MDIIKPLIYYVRVDINTSQNKFGLFKKTSPRKWIVSVPKRIGAYVITHTPDNIRAERYAGSTNNLYKRMNDLDHCNKNILYICMYITDDIILAQRLERIFMELVKPATNKILSPLSNDDRELMKELHEDIKFKEILSDNGIKIGCRYLKYVKNKRTIKEVVRGDITIVVKKYGPPVRIVHKWYSDKVPVFGV